MQGEIISHSKMRQASDIADRLRAQAQQIAVLPKPLYDAIQEAQRFLDEIAWLGAER